VSWYHPAQLALADDDSGVEVALGEGFAAPFQGRWRVVEMDEWDEEARDLVEPAFICFDGEEGEMRFVAVVAWLDVRYGAHSGSPIAEFTWEGVDEGDQRSGHGWPNSEPPDASSATFSSTTVTIPVSSASIGEKVNSLPCGVCRRRITLLPSDWIG
jgi:hypothetical protein